MVVVAVIVVVVVVVVVVAAVVVVVVAALLLLCTHYTVFISYDIMLCHTVPASELKARTIGSGIFLWLSASLSVCLFVSASVSLCLCVSRVVLLVISRSGRHFGHGSLQGVVATSHGFSVNHFLPLLNPPL